MIDFVSLVGYIGVTQNECQAHMLNVVKEYVLRRTKKDVAIFNASLTLPECTIQLEYSDFNTAEERRLYDNVYLKMKKEVRMLKENDNKNVFEALERLLRMRQICIHPQLYFDGIASKEGCEPTKWTHGSTKLNSLMKVIVKEEKTLVFCQFRKEMNLYIKTLQNKGFHCTKIDGSMTQEERDTAVNQFKTSSKFNVFVIQINTGGQGYNLQEATHVIITSPNWSPCLEYQAIGRAHRTGQKNPVKVTKLIINSQSGADMIEDSILTLQRRKQRAISELLQDPRIKEDGEILSKSQSLTMNDISRIFKI
jgi:SNF2 family DNA or RNA helicase